MKSFTTTPVFLRKKYMAWGIALLTLLVMIPTAIISTANYFNLAVEAVTSTAVEGGSDEGTLRYGLVEVSPPSSEASEEATLICPTDLDAYINGRGLKVVKGDAAGGGVLISKDLATALQLTVGDEVVIKAGGSTEAVKVSGILQGVYGVVLLQQHLCSRDGIYLGTPQITVHYTVTGLRAGIVKAVADEVGGFLHLWFIISGAVVFASTAVLVNALLRASRRELGLLKELGAGTPHILSGLMASLFLGGTAGVVLGVSAGLIAAQAVFKAGGFLGLTAGIKPFLEVGDLTLLYAIYCGTFLLGGLASYIHARRGIVAEEVAGWG